MTSCPCHAGANVAQVRRHLQPRADRSSTVQDVAGANSSCTPPPGYNGPSAVGPTLQTLCLRRPHSGLLTTLPSFFTPPPHLSSTPNANNSVLSYASVFPCQFLALCLCLVVMGILVPFEEPNHLARSAKMSLLTPKRPFFLTYICTHTLQ